MSEVPIFQYTDAEGREKTGEIYIGNPEDVWTQLVQECQTEQELKELEEHVHLFKMGPDKYRKYYVILTDVQPAGEELYLPRFGASRIPIDNEIFMTRVCAEKSVAKLPDMFNKDYSDVFEVIR